MRVKDVLEYIDEIKPHPYSEKILTRWLSDCEGMVQTQVMLLAPVEQFTYSYPEDEETVLLVNPPFDKLYPSYLSAMIDYANGEYNKYANTMQMFNSEFSEFMRWFANTYRPADTDTERSEDDW